ncbi:MAG: STAS domain-containing protein [Candidatus Omnitrophica bacterium]|nr:STAS domain-containing protein [Candidatus Omnitrophota bacterium]
MNDEKSLCKNDNVTVRNNDGTVTITIAGNFNGSTTPPIYACCKKIPKSNAIKKIVIDFDKATHVDTAAFACVISYIKEHLSTSQAIFVANLHDPEKKLIELLKVEKIIKIM